MFFQFLFLLLQFSNICFGFNCKDDIYKNCEMRAKRGECEVNKKNENCLKGGERGRRIRRSK